jgi:hypothetical protein
MLVPMWTPVLLLLGFSVTCVLLARTDQTRDWSNYAGSAAVALSLALLLLWGPRWLIAPVRGPKETPDELRQAADLENKNRATLAQIIAGAVLLGGLYFTWQGAQASWGGVRAALHRLELDRDTQVAERFTRAIEHVGSDKLEVRLGGIYALERIAQDSQKDHWTVMEVLTAYIRERAAWSDDREIPSHSEPLATDIQAVLTVLARRTHDWDKGRSLDLQRTDLRRVHLDGAHLEGANLFAARLDGAMLREAYLEGAHLSAARLQGARLAQAHLERANLMSAHLDPTNLEEAHLEGAWLTGASLKGADLRGADLRGVDLRLTRGLTREQIESAITDETTIRPDYLKEGQEEE